MNIRTRSLLLVLLLLPAACLLAGCKSTRQKWEDAKHYFLTDVMRW